MANSKSTYIKTNKLYGMKEGSTTLSAAKAVYVGGTLSKRAYKGGTLVYDVWDTLLSADNFNMPAIGGDIRYALTVTSTMTSVDGTVEDLEYTLSRTEIPANTSTTSKTYTITITQTATGKTIDVICTQAATVQTNVTYGTPSVTSATANQVMASGGSSRLIIAYTQTKTTTYSNGETETDTISGSATATSISGNEQNDSGAYVSSNTISVPSAGTNEYYGNRVVFNITGYTFSANGKSRTVSNADIDVEQLENQITGTSYDNYVLKLTPNKTNLEAGSNTAITILVESTRMKYNTYTSGATDDGILEGINATLSTTQGRLSSKTGAYADSVSIANGNLAYFIPHSNETSNEREVVVNAVSSANSSITANAVFTQAAATYEFSIDSDYINFSYSGGETRREVYNTKNGDMNAAPTVTNNNSWILTEITLSEDDNYTWILTVSAGSNPNTTSRSGTFTLTQAGSGQILTIEATQGGQPSSGGDDTSNTRASIEGTLVDTIVNYEGTISTDANYIENITVQVENSPYGGGNVYGEPVVHDDILSNGDTFSGTIDIGGAYSGLYVLVYYKNEVIGYRIIEE